MSNKKLTKEKIAGTISFLGSIGGGLFALYILIVEKVNSMDGGIILLILVIVCLATILYVLWTKFGNRKTTELEKIEYENEILKRQLEQKELKKKLEA